MILRNFLLTLLLLLPILINGSEKRYVGGDISLFPTYENEGVVYKDKNGNKIELLPYLYDIGMNAMRVRLFVNPGEFEAFHPDDYDPNACQSLPYIIPLCKDIISNGFDLILDFHYSDTWADPDDQWIPDAWKGLSDEELSQKIYDYTTETLLTLKENGIVPAFIQPGNEISYGMLWAGYGEDIPDNHAYLNGNKEAWLRFGDFLKSAVKAYRENCPEAKIILHTERVAQVNVLTNFYSMMESLDINYDIIGLSYYPYYHGELSQLDSALSTLENEYPDKNIMIVETGYPLYWEFEDKIYDLSEFGFGTEKEQNEYAKALVKLLLEHPNVNGLFWWWLEYNPYISDSQRLENWYNAPLFDPYTGKVLPATETIASFGTGNGNVESLFEDYEKDERWFDIQGRSINKPTLPGIYINNGKKVIVPR